MARVSRRQFVTGLAGVGAAGLVLSAKFGPTPAAGEADEYERLLRAGGRPLPAAPKGKLAATEECILGPYFRAGAPYRAKVTPPLVAGTTLLVRGRVWGVDSRKPLPGALIEVWQADAKGRYDNDDPRKPPAPDVFLNRARLLTDETGYYEYETIHPGAYQIGPDAWRPSHIHYAISARGYQTLITQLFFQGDRFNKTDRFIKESLVIEVATKKAPSGGTYEDGTFDIVLAPASR